MTENVSPAEDQQPVPGTDEVLSGTTPESETETTDVEDQNDETDGGTEGEDDAKSDRKEPVGFERRVKKLTTQAKAAADEAAYWKREAMKNAGTPAVVAKTVEDKPKPRFDEYNDIEAYGEAVAEWTSERAVQKALAQRDAERQATKVADTYVTRLEEFKKTTPDFDDVIGDLSDTPIHNVALESIMESEVGPQIAYHLATNPNLAQKISKLSPAQALKEIGKLEAKFEKPPEKVAVSTTKKISTAPASAKTPNGTSPGKDPSQMTPEEWMKWRNANDRTVRHNKR